MQDLLDRMCQRVQRHTDGWRLKTSVPRLGLGVSHQNTVPATTLYEPMICLVLQGAKQVMIGTRVLRYDAASCFVASLELPATGCVMEASNDRPYVVTSLALDRDVLATLVAELPPAPHMEMQAGFGVAAVTTELLAAWDQLLALLDTPSDIPVLGPMREREVMYRLLQGGHGPMLRQVGREDSRLSQIRRAIEWTRRHFVSPAPDAPRS